MSGGESNCSGFGYIIIISSCGIIINGLVINADGLTAGVRKGENKVSIFCAAIAFCDGDIIYGEFRNSVVICNGDCSSLSSANIITCTSSEGKNYSFVTFKDEVVGRCDGDSGGGTSRCKGSCAG